MQICTMKNGGFAFIQNNAKYNKCVIEYFGTTNK